MLALQPGPNCAIRKAAANDECCSQGQAAIRKAAQATGTLQPVPNCYSQFAKPREATNVAARGELCSATFIILKIIQSAIPGMHVTRTLFLACTNMWPLEKYFYVLYIKVGDVMA